MVGFLVWRISSIRSGSSNDLLESLLASPAAEVSHTRTVFGPPYLLRHRVREYELRGLRHRRVESRWRQADGWDDSPEHPCGICYHDYRDDASDA